MASMTGLTAEQLAQLLDGPDPLPMPTYSLDSIYAGTGMQPANPLPTYVEGGIIPPIGVAGTKRNRGDFPPAYNSLSEPWGGNYNQTAYRSPASTRLPSEPTGGPKKLPPVDTQTAIVREIDPRTLSYGDPLTTSANGAIEVMVRGGNQLPQMPRRKPLFPLTQFDQALAIGRAYEPSASVKAALAAPPPPGSPGAPRERSGGLLGLLLGGMEGGGLGSLLSGGGRATGDQLASMQAAASLAQDPALAEALAAGRKGYVPTNPDATGVLGSGALMPTVAMNGNPIRNR